LSQECWTDEGRMFNIPLLSSQRLGLKRLSIDR
jgi:hypothetical protein